MYESEENKRKSEGSVERHTRPGDSYIESHRSPAPTRIPAPNREQGLSDAPSLDQDPVDYRDPDGFVNQSQRIQQGPNQSQTDGAVQRLNTDQYASSFQKETSYETGRFVESENYGQRTSPNPYTRPLQSAQPTHGAGYIQRTMPISKKNSSQDWEDSFDRGQKLTAGKRRLLDKILFALVLIGFIAVLFMLIYKAYGDGSTFSLRSLIEKGSSIQIFRDAEENSTEASTVNQSGETQMDPAVVNMNQPPAIPAAPLFPLPLQSRSYVVWDVQDERLLYEAAAEELRDPASITKVMTALVVLESNTSLDATITLTEEDFAGLVEMDASMAGFKPGETLSVRDLLYGTLLPSGAEASRALARLVGGSEAGFVDLMNQEAQELGMTKTVFQNASGLEVDGKHTTSTARDLLALFRAAIEYPEFVEIAGTHMRSLPLKPEHPEGLDLVSTFTWRFNSDPEHRANILAGKSGYNGREASLGTFATVGGKNYLVITLGASTEDGQSGDSVHDHVVIHNHLLNGEE